MKCNFLNFRVLMAILAIAIAGCGGDDDETQPTDITVGNSNVLTQTAFADQTQATAVTFTTTGAWTSSIGEGVVKSTAPTWVTISPTSGAAAGSHTLTITLSPNATGADRAAAITITSGEATVTVNVTQKFTLSDGTAYNPNNPNIPVWNLTPPQKGDVYVAGGSRIWKNGVQQNLQGSTSIFVSGGIVYVAGTVAKVVNSIPHERDGQIFYQYEYASVATVFKNGVAQYLTDATTDVSATSVFVSGNDVYVAGNETVGTISNPINVAKVWKNGELLHELGSRSYAYSVYVYAGDVYVAGHIFYPSASTGQYRATLWKNGINQILPSGTVRTWANSVFVSENGVYVAGRSHANWDPIGAAWVYGSNIGWQDLTPWTPPNWAEAHSVFVSGTDVYVVGNTVSLSVSTARLWKNGELQNLEAATNSIANSVFVVGNDVYVLGNNKLWKNGIVQKLPNGNDHPGGWSIFVVE